MRSKGTDRKECRVEGGVVKRLEVVLALTLECCMTAKLCPRDGFFLSFGGCRKLRAGRKSTHTGSLLGSEMDTAETRFFHSARGEESVRSTGGSGRGLQRRDRVDVQKQLWSDDKKRGAFFDVVSSAVDIVVALCGARCR